MEMNLLEHKIAGHCQFHHCFFVDPLSLHTDGKYKAGLFTYKEKDSTPVYNIVSHKKLIEIIDIYQDKEDYRELLFEMQYLSVALFKQRTKELKPTKDMAAVMLPEAKK